MEGDDDVKALGTWRHEPSHNGRRVCSSA